MNKNLTLKEHLKKIQPLGGKARWKDKTPEEKKEHGRMMYQTRIRNQIKREAETNIKVEALKDIIK